MDNTVPQPARDWRSAVGVECSYQPLPLTKRIQALAGILAGFVTRRVGLIL